MRRKSDKTGDNRREKQKQIIDFPTNSSQIS
jgi:hypothetical protein